MKPSKSYSPSHGCRLYQTASGRASINLWQKQSPVWHKYIWRDSDINAPEFRFPFNLLATSLAALYGGAARARRELYRQGWLPAKHLPAPVISIGNLTVGGTGKTPMVAFLASKLQQQGSKVAILSRGYGGRRTELARVADGEHIFLKPPEVGEEAYWLAKTLPGAIVYTCPSRHEAGIAAWQEHRPDLFLLDDGFQHFQLHRDLDIVLLDGSSPIGNGKLLPAGPLREPITTLAVADVFIISRNPGSDAKDWFLKLKETYPDKVLTQATIEPVFVRSYPEGKKRSLNELKNLALFGFAGIARPRDFEETLHSLGVDLKGFADYPDHHPFSAAELIQLEDGAKKSGARALITTSKDWARMGEEWAGGLPLWVLEVEVNVVHSELLLDRINQVLESVRKNSGAFVAPASHPGYNPAFAATSVTAGSFKETAAQPLPPEVRQRFQNISVLGKSNLDRLEAQNILVRVPNWVGDAVMGLPVLSGLARRFPQASITVLAAPRVAPLLAANPSVSEVITYPSGRRKWRLLLGLRGRFDLGLALPNSLESALGLWLAGAKVRVGYNADRRRALLTTALDGPQKLKGLHTVFYLLGVLRAFGEVADFSQPKLYLTESEIAEAQGLLNAHPGPWVAISPGAAYGPAKRWPPERFAAIGARLTEEIGLRLALLGGPEDRPAAGEVARHLHGKCLNLTGRTSLRQALAVLPQMRLLITNDSGLMHAAAALGVPVVAIFGSTDPGATRPFTDKATVLYHGLACSPCLERTCTIGYPCLTEVSVDEVYAVARGWLDEAS